MKLLTRKLKNYKEYKSLDTSKSHPITGWLFLFCIKIYSKGIKITTFVSLYYQKKENLT
jgi:hypothetical protein